MKIKSQQNFPIFQPFRIVFEGWIPSFVVFCFCFCFWGGFVLFWFFFGGGVEGWGWVEYAFVYIQNHVSICWIVSYVF